VSFGEEGVRPMKWRQFTIRGLLLVVTVSAFFCAGYHVGFRNGRDARYDDLITLIRETVAPSSWNDTSIGNNVGGSPLPVSDDPAGFDPFAVNSRNKMPPDDPFSSPDEVARMPRGQGHEVYATQIAEPKRAPEPRSGPGKMDASSGAAR
jgi:hypothetical protein